MKKYVDQKLNIVKVRPVDVSSNDFYDENGFFVRADTGGDLVYVPFAHREFGTVSYSIASNVATIVCDRDVSSYLAAGDDVYISGMTNTALNGVFTLTDVDEDEITFSVTAEDDEGDDTGGTIYQWPITKTIEASVKFDDPEIIKLIISSGTTADDIYVGYAR